jgi:hypothetical protein
MWSNGATSEDLSGLAPGSYTVTVSDAHNCPMVGSWVVLITDPVCANITVTGAVTSTVCYDAYNTITVAGGVSTFTVSSPGNATFIAGVNILFKPGTLVSSGGYMRGYISASFCSPSDAPMVATAAAYDEPQAGLSNASFTLYPNPTNGNFTLVQKGENSFGNVRVDIYNMNGNRVMNAQMIGEKSHEFASSSLPSGIYFVKIIADGSVETIKLIVTR